jgi:hypothetical protein
LASLGTASQHQSLVVRSEETCAVGTPSGYDCFVLQLALQAPGSEKHPFKMSLNLKILEEIVQSAFGARKFTGFLDTTWDWEVNINVPMFL